MVRTGLGGLATVFVVVTARCFPRSPLRQAGKQIAASFAGPVGVVVAMAVVEFKILVVAVVQVTTVFVVRPFVVIMAP